MDKMSSDGREKQGPYFDDFGEPRSTVGPLKGLDMKEHMQEISTKTLVTVPA